MSKLARLASIKIDGIFPQFVFRMALEEPEVLHMCVD
jgi:hypothetical protein